MCAETGMPPETRAEPEDADAPAAGTAIATEAWRCASPPFLRITRRQGFEMMDQLPDDSPSRTPPEHPTDPPDEPETDVDVPRSGEKDQRHAK
jgi:hypothetical protein